MAASTIGRATAITGSCSSALISPARSSTTRCAPRSSSDDRRAKRAPLCLDLRVLNVRRLILMFVLGGIGGALVDQIHVRFGVLFYPEPFFLGQGWWVAANFGIATII